MRIRRKSYLGLEPRLPTIKEYDDWFAGASKQKPSMTRAQLRNRMRSRNFVRWNRLRRDYRWLQREMKKAGLNPEEAWCLL